MTCPIQTNWQVILYTCSSLFDTSSRSDKNLWSRFASKVSIQSAMKHCILNALKGSYPLDSFPFL
jgi:hypothetical protein